MLSDQRLQELENAYSLLDESVIILDCGCALRAGNAAASELLGENGLSRAAWGQGLEAIVEGIDHRKRLLRDVKCVLEDGMARERLALSGYGQHLHHKMTPIKDTDGRVEGVLLRSFSNSARVRERARFEHVQSMTLTVWWEWNIPKDALKLYAPDNCILGFDPGSFVPTIKYWEDKVHPDDLEDYNGSLRDCLEGRVDEWAVEHRYLDANGDWRWIKTRGIISERGENGEPIEMIGATVNCDRQKRHELELVEQTDRLGVLTERLALATAEAGIWDFDIKNDVLVWDESMFRLYEVAPEEFAGCYEAWASRVHPDDLERSAADVQTSIETKTEFYSLFRICLPGGRIRWIESRANLKFDENGEPIRLVGSNFDVTELTLAREEVEKTKEKAEAASKAKSDFLAMMSHELRTPLNPIVGLTELLLLEKGLNEEQASWMDTIHSRSRDLLRLIDDILDISRIESGRLAVDLEPVKLTELVSDVLDIYRLACSEKGVTLVCDVDARFSEPILLDPGKTRQVLLNLVGNAVKFTESGEIRVSASYDGMAPDDDNLPEVRFGVRDTGPGIPEDERKAIFDSFYQIDMSMTRRKEGVGLGLAICKRLLDVMEGRVWIDSDYEGGAHFHVSIPLGQAEEKPDEVVSLVSTPLSGVESVLIVEDEDTNAQTLGLMLQSLSIKSRVAKNGQEAVDACEAEAFDLVLMDVKMPVMDGLKATEVLRAKGFEMPIIGATAFAFESDEAACLEAGMNAWLPKPIGLSALKEKIVSVCPTKAAV